MPLRAEVEYSAIPERIDHIWLTFTLDYSTEMRAALNTTSRRNREEGFDPRIRLGVVKEVYEKLPAPGVFDSKGFDYSDIEGNTNIFYEYHDHIEMNAILLEKIARAILVEIWGDIYAHRHNGIHQIHSRRASCAVADDIVGRDGALKLYYMDGNASELLLFKFCGQP